VCLIDEFGEILFEGKRDTHAGQIKDILRPFGVEAVQRITIEAGVGTHMVRELQEQGFPRLCRGGSSSASKFLAIRRQKTDANDARGLAELGRDRTHHRVGGLRKAARLSESPQPTQRAQEPHSAAHEDLTPWFSPSSGLHGGKSEDENSGG
jgi:hypothetical protein